MDLIYDIETYPNCFTFSAIAVDSDLKWQYEISDFKNESVQLVGFLRSLPTMGYRLVGFNNLGFDYPVIHKLLQMGIANAKELYDHAMAIIGCQDTYKWKYQVYPSDRIVKQIDLFKIHHFDNRAKTTSLKMLEFNMRMDNISDLPFPVGTELNKDQIKELMHYNMHDCVATKKFYFETLPMIEFREELSHKYKQDFLNHNDVKIGTTIFERELESRAITLYDYVPGEGRKARQTPRPVIDLNQAILPWIKFENAELQRVVDWLRQQKITETKGVFKDLVATVNGFQFVFGLGGIHGSVESQVVESDDQDVILDLDVASYYPNLAIGQRFYPAHLGEKFCDIYQDLFKRRRQYAKGTAENAMLKLALNGTYGQSNSRFSVFYDPLFTMSITLNGQLLLCILAEQLLKIDGLHLIQVNTDGLTVKVNRELKDQVDMIRQWWEKATNLELEEAVYKAMYIRDVNNYIAEYEDGKVKRKGAYEHELQWHQNQSALVVPKVAELHLVHGKPIRSTVESWPNIMDFMLRTKVPRSSKLMLYRDGIDELQQNISRYLVTKTGGQLIKMMPPTQNMVNKGKTEWRRISIESGWNVSICNNIEFFNPAAVDIDFNYYVQEVEKLVLGLA